MKKVSDKQRLKDRELAKIKASLPKVCYICGRNCICEGAHILPRSTFPEYYTLSKNLIPLCKECHFKYDNNLDFRQEQEHIFEIAKEIDKLAAIRHFKKYD
jgi:hypothetical protein